ncbi:MAG: F0F1 ATP synthase subunit delta [Dehalococcoidales bacterium]|jgi:F-type H+-transporting ATPase subunit delta|nr:F0F1 ATP synthase subunit delta [Dehalococcoidales bacterium]MDP7309786.1 F0F1 ATP synthase subunit delta [Dehalococcoidales bacterium]MDP7409808.1 F0F1 ATP synthase subunit delta [Dehalococcoidales bacterium]MDP7676097.1 F0F1 ATP synthase subunit delta [Dehalococcoidales bacterium]HJM36364.1 F0F1 ATP synthase subunit delta [Dehalococcoidales bacterium]|tara:strand:- start:241 stop:780 length:540 start_codon:yes stop_codon:yes gene_type:complete
MARRAYARRYARAVFQVALERQELDRWQSDLNKVVGLGKDDDLVALLENPKLRFSDKAKLLAERLGEINPFALNLVYLLVTRDKFSLVGEINEEYQRLLDSHHGIEPAVVVTAVLLDDETKSRLAKRLEAIVGKKVVVQHEVDPNVLGGVVARVGGKLLDGSTRSRLVALKKELREVRR